MVKLKQRLSEGDISVFLKSKRGHKPLLESRSLPVRAYEERPLESVTKVVQDTMGQIQESEKEVEWAAREVEYIIRKEKRAIEEFERKSGASDKGGNKSGAKGVGTLRSWINLKIETDKNHQAAKEDLRRAAVAMKAAEDKINNLEGTLQEEERRLEERARELRRKSLDMFKLVDHRSLVARAENARVNEDGDLRICEVTSL